LQNGLDAVGFVYVMSSKHNVVPVGVGRGCVAPDG
jgi:hypothetical protein